MEKYFQLWLEFLFPRIAQEIDWEKPPVHLDKELLAIQKRSKIGKRIADKLIQVFKKNGEITWIILHIEVQGGHESHFSRRLFEYYYKIHDRYKIPVVTLAILTDPLHGWRPCEYLQSIWGCTLQFKYPIVKLIDFIPKEEILSQSKNPIAKVIQAHLAALASRKNLALKLENKLKLVKNLYALGYTGDDIRILYEFIDYAISLSADLNRKFLTEMHKYEETINMGYVTSTERIGIEKGLEQGLEKGIEKGIGLGIQEMFLLALKNRLGSNIPQNITERVRTATQQELKSWFEKFLSEKLELAELDSQ